MCLERDPSAIGAVLCRYAPANGTSSMCNGSQENTHKIQRAHAEQQLSYTLHITQNVHRMHTEYAIQIEHSTNFSNKYFQFDKLIGSYINGNQKLACIFGSTPLVCVCQTGVTEMLKGKKHTQS